MTNNKKDIMDEKKSICFPEVAFPKDFRKSVMSGKNHYKKYNLDYLMKNGFVVVYTILNSNEEIHEKISSMLRESINKACGGTLIADMGNKGPIEYFNDVLYSWYELIRGTGQMSVFPMQILFFVTSISHLFSDDEEAGHIYMNTCAIKTKMGGCDIIMISNKKGFVNEPLSNTIIDAHLDNLKVMMEKQQRKESFMIKNNKGIIVQGDNASISNISISNNDFFQTIYNLIEEKNPANKEEVINAVRDIEKKGKNSHKWKFLKENASWVIPMVEAVIKIKEAIFG